MDIDSTFAKSPLITARFRDVVVLGFGLILIVLVAGGVLGYLSAGQLAHYNQRVTHTYQVIGELEILLSSIKDAETGQRGYLLTQEKPYLDPYLDALNQVHGHFANLKVLMSDAPEQQARLKTLELTIDEKLVELKSTIDLEDQKDHAGALAIIRDNRGKHFMDDIRNQIAAMQQVEHEALLRRTGESKSSYQSVLLSILLPAALGLFLISITFYLFRRSSIQRVRAAKLLFEQKERLRTTLASIGDGVITTDVQGRVTNLNAVAAALTGWSNAEAAGVPLIQVFNIVNETSRKVVENPVTRSLREGMIVGLANHTILIAKDGVERHIDDSASPIRSEGGEIVGCVLIFRDIGEQRRIERERDLAAARIASVVNHAVDGIVTIDESGMIESFNPAGEKLFGYQASEVIGQNVKLLLPEPLHSEPDQKIADYFRSGEAKAFGTAGEVQGRRKDGTTFPMELGVSEFVLGEHRFFTALIHDITERKQAEELLQRSEKRIRFVMDSMPQKIFTATPEGKLDYFNPYWTDYTGISFDQIREQGWKQFIQDEDLTQTLLLWRQSIASSQPFQFEHRFGRHDGVFRWHLTRALPVRDEAGVMVMWIGSNTDIHEQKETAENLRRLTAELSEAGRRKDEFIAMLAHELRNPLAPIRNGLQIMRLTRNDEAVVEQARAMMERQLGHMIRLVDDLLDVSRISRGKLQLRKERIELSTALRNAIETSRPLIEAGGHQLTLGMPGQPIMLDADVTRLGQVFANLLNNAAKYCERGGHIDIVASISGEDVVVSIKDTGVGIPPEMLPRIFEMFTQVDRSLERSQGGLGIGLSLVKRLVEMHGGSVEARSEGHGKGSELIVRLPMVKPIVEQRSDSGDAARQASQSAQRRILVADDNVDSADTLAMMLKIMGNDVRTANDGLEAVETATTFQPEVILLDIGMPELNGYEACQRIREQPWGKKITLIALTGWGQDEDKRRSEEAGFDHHLVKPVDPAVLENLLAGLGSHG